MNYTLTLIERPEFSKIPDFDPEIEDKPLDVPFVTLKIKPDAGSMKIAPITKANLDTTYAIFITGHVEVNKDL